MAITYQCINFIYRRANFLYLQGFLDELFVLCFQFGYSLPQPPNLVGGVDGDWLTAFVVAVFGQVDQDFPLYVREITPYARGKYRGFAYRLLTPRADIAIWLPKAETACAFGTMVPFVFAR